MQQIPFTISDNEGRSSRLSSERLINYYAEVQSNAEYDYSLIGVPGVDVFEDLGDGPIRGIITRNNVRYVVSGGEVYKDGVLLAGNSVGGSGTVSMAHNDAQVVIVGGGNGYVVDAIVEVISDADWKTSDTVTYLSGVFIFNERGTGRAFSSEINDASDLDALDFATAETSSDDLIGVYTEGIRLVMAGRKTIEFWIGDGGPQFPFSALPYVASTGIRSPYGFVLADNTFFFLGDDLSIYRMAQVPQRISTSNVERAIRGYTNQDRAIARTYSRDSHVFVVFDFDDGTWVYDISTQLWHERLSYKKSSSRYSQIWQDGQVVYAGSKDDGTVYTLEEETFDEDGAVLEGFIQTPQVSNKEEWYFATEVKLAMQTGVGLTIGQGSDPQVMMQYSDDGGKTWSFEQWKDIGKIGVYKNIVNWYRQGRTLGRAYRFKITDPVQRDILGLWFDG